MTTIAWPDGTFDTIGQILTTTGRSVQYRVQTSASGCRDCSLDPVTNTSTNVFCETCDGLYWTPVFSEYLCTGHVVWSYSDRLTWERGGQIPEGGCRVTMQHTLLLEEKVKASHDWTVDGKTMYMKDYKLKGIRDGSEAHAPSRIAVTLKEEDD